jgi:hypothetical protein
MIFLLVRIYISLKYKLQKKRTCVLAVLQAGMMALETLAFSATLPEFQLSNQKNKVNWAILPPATREPRMLLIR